MLENYMNHYTKQELLKQVEQIEELIGPEFIKKPRGLVYTQNGKEHRSAHFDLTPLKKALMAYIKAYNNSPKETKADWDALAALWIKVGLPQREVPAHIAQEYCHSKRSFEEVSKNPSLLDASNPDNLERQLKFYNWVIDSYDYWFTHDSYSADSRLGVSFAILRGGAERRGASGATPAGRPWRVALMDLSAIETIDKTRTDDLKQSLANLDAPSILQAAQPHGS
jgi:hypothetical protein